MGSWPYSHDDLRAMYRGGRGNATARRFSRMWAAVFGLGLAPRRWVTLEVPGRRSGRVTRFPLGMADLDGQWYLVPMLGGRCNWVQNVRASGGRATLRRRRAVACRLVEVPVAERAPIIKRYLQKVPGGRPHIPVDRRAPVADFEAVAPRYPVFRVAPLDGPGRPARKRHWWRWIAASALDSLANHGVAVPHRAAPRGGRRSRRRGRDLWPGRAGLSTLMAVCSRREHRPGNRR